MARSINFSAGPAALPLDVLERIKDELIDYSGTGHSVMEMSHRSSEYMEIAARSESTLRTIYDLSDDFEVLFLQGGATLQFTMIPLNFCTVEQPAGYVETGLWSRKARRHATRVRPTTVVASGTSAIEDMEAWTHQVDSPYVHLASNETVDGIQFPELPSLDGTCLCVDMSSDFLIRPFRKDAIGLAYASAQKNAGPAGLTLVILRRDVLERMSESISPVLAYRSHAREGSMLNTPPTFSWYVAGLVFDWVLSEGGVDVMAQRSREKSRMLYEVIDQSDLYTNSVPVSCRSTVNVPFMLREEKLNETFLAVASERGLCNLAGHRKVGGMRASLYNAISTDDVQQLTDFMQEFEQRA